MAYNLLNLRSRVRTKIKDSSYSASQIDDSINDAILEIAALYPFKWFAKANTSNSLSVSSNTFDNPTDHEITEFLILVHPTQATRYWNITKYRKTPDEFFELFPAADALGNSQPTFWTEYGNKIYFNCPSDLAYRVRQYYQKIPTELTADADVPELPSTFREAIMLGASYRCEEERDNYDIAAILQNRFNDKVADLILRFGNDTMTGPDTVIMPGQQQEDW